MINTDLYCLCVLLFFVSFRVDGQQKNTRCSSVKYQEDQFQQLQISKDEFENQFKLKRVQRRVRKSEEIIVIPVVVHVVHDNFSSVIGGPSNSNISDEQINSQLLVINEDFRRQNADSISTPLIFRDISSDAKIEFVLATIDPEGFPTRGITRTFSSSLPYNPNSSSDDRSLKTLIYWPSTQYLNIWITELSGDVLGYATFPSDAASVNGLEGLDIQEELDGIVIDHHVFGKGVGTVATTGYYANGRTATHEIGHWLGLYHIWGDADNCSATDYCDDTPSQEVESVGCPLVKFNCNGKRFMFENYMDYSSDACMNLFTKDQTSRMRDVLEVSERRHALLSSPGLCKVNNMVDLPFESILDETIDIDTLWLGTTAELGDDGADISRDQDTLFVVTPMTNLGLLDKPFLGIKYDVQDDITLVVEYAAACSNNWLLLSEQLLENSSNWLNVDLAELIDFQSLQFRFYLKQPGLGTLNYLNIHSEVDLVKVGPNPFLSELSLLLTYSGRQEVEVSIFDINGNVVFQKNYFSSFSTNRLLNLEKILEGFYILRVSINGQVTEKKIVKIR